MKKPSADLPRPSLFDPAGAYDIRDMPALLDYINQWCAAENIAVSTFGRRTMGGTYEVSRLGRMAETMVRKIDKVLAYMTKGMPPPPERVEIRFTVGIPTTTNKLYSRNADGSLRRSEKYRKWALVAGQEIMVQRPQWTHRSLPHGGFATHIELPYDDDGDIDNRIKSMLDLMHHMSITSDDRRQVDLRVTRTYSVEPGQCRVKVSSVPV